MPRLGVNEDVVTIVAWDVESGDRVHQGQKLADLETTKVSLTLEAEAEGYVYLIREPGEEVPVRDVIAVILDRPDAAAAGRLASELRASPQPARSAVAGEVQLTDQARKLVATMDVDISGLPRDRILREADIRALFQNQGSDPPVGADTTRQVVVYGASQGGFAAAETLLAMGGFEVAGYLDDTPGRAGGTFHGLPVWSGTELGQLSARGIGGLISHIMDRAFRLEIRERARAAGLAMPNAIHPYSYVARSARLGVGNVIKAGAVLDADVRVGDCCIIDNGAVVAHNNVIGDGCSLAPGATLAGDSQIGERTLIGTGATLIERLRIGTNVIVSAGAVVVRDVPDNAVVAGSPARQVGERR